MKNLNKYFVIVIAALFLIQPAFSALAYIYPTSVESTSYDSGYTYGSYDYGYIYPTSIDSSYDYGSYDYGYIYPTSVESTSYDSGYTYGSYDYGYTYPTSVESSSYDYGYIYPTSVESSSYDYGYIYPTSVVSSSYTYPSYSSCSSGSCYTPYTYTLATSSCGSGCYYFPPTCTTPSCTYTNVVASCSVSPNPAQVNQGVTFNGSASGGTGSYTYSWSGNCSGSSQNCYTSFYNTGNYLATLTVTSGGQTSSTTCTVNVQGGNTSLSINKLAKNITDGTGYQDSVSADQNERVGFSIQVTNTGSSTANNVQVSDTLPSQLSYSGNLQLDGSYNSGSITSGINIGSLSVGQSRTITFETTVNSTSGYSTITNTARAWSDNVSQVSDTATVNVSYYTNTSLSIDKQVKNNTSYTGYQNSINANSNDSISYSIRVYNSGSNSAYNVMVRDVLPTGITSSGNIRLDGNYVGGDLTSGINIGSLYNGQSKTITFDATVNNYSGAYVYYGYSNNLINTATAWADNISQVSDTATVNTSGNTNTNISVNKLVRNLSDGTAWADVVNADPGEIVSFSIQVTANSGYSAYDIYVKDTLPSRISYYGNLKLDNNVISGDIINGVNIGTLSSGQSKTITFDARVAGETQFSYGTSELINTALAYNTSISATDTARVNVTRSGVLGAVTEICTAANPLWVVMITMLLLAIGFYFALPYLENSNNPAIRKALGVYYRTKAFVLR